MADQLSILNDPNFTPLITHSGQCLITHIDERFLIARSSLRNRPIDPTTEAKRGWMMKKGLMNSIEAKQFDPGLWNS